MNESFDQFFFDEVITQYETLRKFVFSSYDLTLEQYNKEWQDYLSSFLRACRIAEFDEIVQLIEHLKRVPYESISGTYRDLGQKLLLPLGKILNMHKKNEDFTQIPELIEQLRLNFSVIPPQGFVTAPASSLAQHIDPRDDADREMRNSLVGIFVEESLDIVGNMSNDLIEFESSPQNMDILNRMFRFAHTLKGNAATLGFDEVKHISHRIESFFDLFRKKELVADISIIDLLSEGTTLLADMLRGIPEGRDFQSMAREYLLKLDNFKQPVPNIAKSKVDTSSIDQPMLVASLRKNIERENQSLRVDSHRLDNIVNLAGEVNIVNNNFCSSYRDVLEIVRNADLLPEKSINDITESLDQYTSLVGVLQGAIIQARMIPLYGIFKKYPALVRTISRQIGKEINFEYSGEQIEVDKSIYEEIADPIMHLIRNCIDHGIESPEERLSLQKPRRGTIRLDARIEGSQIKIIVQDDGRGIYTKLVLEKAISKGLVSEEKGMTLSSRDICDFIFYPGFSTKEDATELSGRGVGMDVVKQNILNLKGMLRLETAAGQGTKVIITLPTSLTIRDVLIVGKDVHALGIPVEFIVEVMDVYPGSIVLLENKEFFSYDDKLVPFIYMRNVFGIRSLGKEKVFKTVLIKVQNDYLAICVDSIERRQQVMMKPLNELIKKIKYINAVSLMGDGSILLLLDPVQVFANLDKISVPVLSEQRKLASRGFSFKDIEEIEVIDYTDMLNYILFSINSDAQQEGARKYFAIEVSKIETIVDTQLLTGLPEGGDSNISYCLHQGETLPVYNISKLFGVAAREINKTIIINHVQQRFGIVCCKVHKLMHVKKNEISTMPDIVKESRIDFISGIIMNDHAEEIIIIAPDELFTKINGKMLSLPSAL